MEMLDIVHADTGHSTGVRLPRAEAIAQEAWCRSTNIFVLNHAGEVLCHQRSLNKERLPGTWMTHLGGHVAVGETYESNARKEIEEEAGIRLAHLPLVAWRTTRVPEVRLWMREFVAVLDLPVEAFAPQPGEVDRFAWLSPEEIARRAASGESWKAGTHGFLTDYACMRAAITAASTTGAAPAAEHLHTWHPVAA